MEIVTTGGPLGAEVRGLDCSKPLAVEEVSCLKQALLDHLLLLFRGQTISDEEQIRFSSYFGDPKPHVRKQPERSLEEIFVVSNVLENGKPIGALGYGELTFHSDLSYLERPGSFSVVYAVEVPQRGGDTQWANCYLAWEALSSSMRERIFPLRAVHRHGEEEQNPAIPARHPVVRTHPESGRRSLYVSPQFTRRIEGLPEVEGRALLEDLLAHVTKPEFVWTHHWRAGDLVIWDNRPTLHRREPFDPGERRILRRTQMFGEVPYT